MAFTSFKSIDQLLLRYDREPFVEPVPGATFSDTTRAEIDFILREYPFDRSEVATREALIFPILKDVWRHYRGHLTLLSGEAGEYDAELRGEVDYVVCRRSPHGPFTPDQPFLLIGEAKRDDATVGWNQALGGMIAAQRLDPAPPPDRIYYGLATSGRSWSFGRLAGSVFTADPTVVTTGSLDLLAQSLHFLFAACRDQVLAAPPQ
ncbi:MAG: hypothetical protein ACRC7O_09810 [Fimbriiglobus sp.]